MFCLYFKFRLLNKKSLFFIRKMVKHRLNTFLYRVRQKDYNRFTKQYLQKILKENNFKNIKIKELGIGPFLACISLLRGYIKYIPLISHLLVITAILIDKLLCFVSKKMLNEIYPIGYIFSAKK